MMRYAPLLGHAKLMTERQLGIAPYGRNSSVPLSSTRLGQGEHYDRDYSYQPGYETFRHYDVPNGPFDVEAVSDIEFKERWKAARTKFLNALYSLMVIPTEAWPPAESYAPAWTKEMNSSYDPEQVAYRDGGVVYVFGEPLENLKRYEEASDAALKAVDASIDQYVSNLKQVEELLKEVNHWLAKVRVLSKVKADQLGTMSEGCRQKGASQEAIVCLEALLEKVKGAAGAPRTPVTVYVISGLAAAGLVGWLIFRK